MSGNKRLRKEILHLAGFYRAEHQSRNHSVVNGFFTLVDGQGIPLDMVLDYFKKHQLVPCWLSFFMESLEKGWNPGSTMTKIRVACEDIYGFEHAAVVVKRLEEHVGL